MRSILFLSGLLILNGCAAAPVPTVITRDVVVQVQIPASMQSCAAAPPVPYPVRRQSTVAHYIVNLWAAWHNCSDTLNAVVGAVQAQEAVANPAAKP